MSGARATDGQQDAAGARWDDCALDRASFVQLVTDRAAPLYRDLPWRNLDDPYAVLVSEVMLQQTQVARVLKYWPRWMAAFPTVDALAAAGTSDVLELWQGLGYNRRALALKRACDACSAQFGGQLPRTAAELVELPGIGPATAGGVIAFAYDEPAVYIETNVRSVFLHHLFPQAQGVTDRMLAPYVADSCPQSGARAWYYALLDYGAHLKTQVSNPSRRSAHYARQSAFAGSHREKRSFVLKCVLAAEGGLTLDEAVRRLGDYEQQAGRERPGRDAVDALARELSAEGFFAYENGLMVQG